MKFSKEIVSNYDPLTQEIYSLLSLVYFFFKLVRNIRNPTIIPLKIREHKIEKRGIVSVILRFLGFDENLNKTSRTGYGKVNNWVQNWILNWISGFKTW